MSDKELCKDKSKCIFKGAVMLVLVLDVFTKTLAEKYRPSGSGFFSLNYTTNTGAAFGMFKNSNLPLIIISLIAVAAIIYYVFYHEKKMTKIMSLSFGLLFAGAMGNLLDRIFRGYVVDFLSFSFWPAFNVADIAITLGVMGLLYIVFKE
jgi:signal peptidase II